MKEAEEMVLRVKKEDEKDKQETEQRRKLRKERVQQALEDSSAAAVRKEEELKSTIVNEDNLMEEYRQRIVERDKRCQEEVWNKVVVRRQMLETAATRQKAEKQKQDETEAKAVRERQEKDARDIEKEKRSSDKLKNERLECQKYLFEQMQKKAEVKEKKKEERKMMGAALEVDARKFFDNEVTRTSAQRQRALEHRAELERQIAT